jgi:hypothetical protein
MRKLMIPWIFIMIMLVGGLTFIGFYQASRYGAYRDLERRLENAARSYLGQFPDRHPNTSKVITSNYLMNEDFLDNLKIEDNQCTGYVIVTRRGRFYNYGAYIKCDNYTTRGFDEDNLANQPELCEEDC